jgi:hypothetical protein
MAALLDVAEEGTHANGSLRVTRLATFLEPGMAAMYPWEEEPASRWARDFSNSPRDNRVPLPPTQLEQEKIGEKSTVHDLFDRWVLNGSVHLGRGNH